MKRLQFAAFGFGAEAEKSKVLGRQWSCALPKGRPFSEYLNSTPHYNFMQQEMSYDLHYR